MAVIHDERWLSHDAGPAHPERPERVRAIVAEMRRSGVADAVDWARAEPASREDLLRVHPAAHLDALAALSARGGGRVDADTVANASTWEAATLAAGAAVQAARRALGGEAAFSLGRPPGHHATPTRAMGFCFVNHVAVAAEWALAHGARRVAILDHDVHHGNGTQDAFWSRDDVLYVSTHQFPLYPGTGWHDERGEGAGEGFTVNAPLPAGVGVRGYARVVDELVLPVLREYAPDVLLVSAGFDSHHRDPLAHFRLDAHAFHALYRKLTREVTPRVAAVLEGGYDLTGLARSATAAIAALVGRDAPAWEDECAPADETDVSARLDELKKAHAGRWSL